MCFTYIHGAHSVGEYCLLNACVVSFLGSYKNLSVARDMAKKVRALSLMT